MTQKQIVVNKRSCPVCTRATIQAKAISETGNPDDSGLWYFCSCGIIFNSEIPKREPKDEKYIKKYEEFKEYKYVAQQPGRVYAPIIEELTMGRKMLDVGFCVPNNMKFFGERGWIPFGIENNKSVKGTDRIINESSEKTENLYKNTYDLIWMSHVLEKFKDPLSAMYKAREILQNNGVIYIATPDIDALYREPSGKWTHWDKKENNVLWNERSLTRELERIGFKVIMSRRNYFSRFGFYNDIHIIAQKIYF